MAEDNGVAGKAAIFGAKERRYKTISVPGLGEQVRIQSITERERSEYEAGFLDKSGNISKVKLPLGKVRLLLLCVVNSEGQRIFSAADVPALGEIDSCVSNVIADACREHCGFTEADIEGLEGNLEETSGDGSPSA